MSSKKSNFRNKVLKGNNLKIMKQMESKSIDLIYLDPPFFTQKDFGEFTDKWDSFDQYLIFLGKRLAEMHRILKDNGSLYLHVDPVASHYLKIKLDDIFGRKNFKNEIIWSYKKWTNNAKRFQKNHDVILYYTKGKEYTFNRPFESMSASQINDRRKGYRWNRKKGTDKEKILCVYDKELAKEKIRIAKKQGIQVDYVNNERIKGMPMGTVWDIPYKRATESGKKYPTQKPEKLLEVIIKASSNKGDIVLDPFCGSGTTLVVAKRLSRNYIGMDKNKKAVKLSKRRLLKSTTKIKQNTLFDFF